MLAEFCHSCFGDTMPGTPCARCGAVNTPPESADVLTPGSILAGKFRIGRLLGRGGFGATYLAWDINLRVRVAIKEFLPRQLATRSPGNTQVNAHTSDRSAFHAGLTQFLDEARNLAQFRNHPCIISVLDFFPENGTGYMVMEYLDGETLDQRARAAGLIDPIVTLRLLVPVADALRALHAVGMIHRDISPDNIFITSDGRVKLLDFGAARIAVGTQTSDFSVILKEGYAPFEQYQRSGRQGPWTDIYALSATMYRLITGAMPVSAPDRVGGTALAAPTQNGKALPPGLAALLENGMALEPERRYKDVDALLADMQAVIAGDPVAPPEPRRMAPKRPRDGARRAPWMVGGAVVTLAAAVLAFFMLPPGAEIIVHPQQKPRQAPGNGGSQVAGVLPVPQPTATPEVPGINRIDQLRGRIRRALQYFTAMRRSAFKLHSNQVSLDSMQAIPVKSAAIAADIRQLEDVAQSLGSDLATDRDNYLGEIEDLARAEARRTDAAMELERTPETSTDIAVLARHVANCRQGTLTADAVMLDAR